MVFSEKIEKAFIYPSVLFADNHSTFSLLDLPKGYIEKIKIISDVDEFFKKENRISFP